MGRLIAGLDLLARHWKLIWKLANAQTYRANLMSMGVGKVLLINAAIDAGLAVYTERSST